MLDYTKEATYQSEDANNFFYYFADYYDRYMASSFIKWSITFLKGSLKF